MSFNPTGGNVSGGVNIEAGGAAVDISGGISGSSSGGFTKLIIGGISIFPRLIATVDTVDRVSARLHDRVMRLLIGNDQTLYVTELQDEVSGSYLDAASVTVTVKTLAGVEVAGQTWPLSMDYVTSSNGKYRGNLTSALAIVDGAFYKIEVTATDEVTAFWSFTVPAQYRTPE